MPLVTLEFLHSKPYGHYLNGGIRPDAKLPLLDFSEDGLLKLLPGEIYCRYRNSRGVLCQKSSRFNTPHGLKVHYRDVHKLPAVSRRTGSLKYEEDQQALQWYTDLFGDVILSKSPYFEEEASENSNDINTIAGSESTHKAGDEPVYHIADERLIQPFDGLDQGQSLPRGKVRPDHAHDRTGDRDEDSANNENNGQVDHVETKSYVGIDKEARESKMIADLHAELEEFI